MSGVSGSSGRDKDAAANNRLAATRGIVYVDRNGQVPARYVRLLTIGRFEIALTWIVR